MQEVKKHCVLNNADFSAFIERVDTAQHKFADQSADEFKKLWSHSDDVTLFGGHGGRVECGWENVAGRLEWSSSTYRQADRGVNSSAGVYARILPTSCVESSLRRGSVTSLSEGRRSCG